MFGKLALCGFLVAIVSPSVANTGSFQFDESCNFKSGIMGDISCPGYIVKVSPAAGQVAAGKSRVCTPDNLAGDQARLIVRNHMRDHPEQLYENTDLLVAIACIRLPLVKNQGGHRDDLGHTWAI